MRYYYNGQLIRTSKTHHYTHAVIIRKEDKVICYGCSSSEKGAEKLMNDLQIFRSYRTWCSVMNGTYKKKDRWSRSIEEMREVAVKEYGSLEKAVESYKEQVQKFEIVEIEEA